jgi:hypothetical protein
VHGVQPEFGDSDFQQPIGEGRRNHLRINRRRQVQDALEPAVLDFGKPVGAVGHPGHLPADAGHLHCPGVDFQIQIVFFHTGNFSPDHDLFRCFKNVHLRRPQVFPGRKHGVDGPRPEYLLDGFSLILAGGIKIASEFNLDVVHDISPKPVSC